MVLNLDLKEIRVFLSSLGSSSLIYHRDGDGVCSAVLLAKYLEKKKNLPELIQPNDMAGIEISKDLLNTIKEYESVIFTDLAVDQLNIVEKLDGKKIFILDHHLPKKNLNSKNVMHINPRFVKPSVYIPASYLAYKIIDNEKLIWIAGIGVISDYGVKDCKDLMEKVKKIYPDFVSEKITQSDLENSKLGLFSKMIEGAEGIKRLKGLQKVFDILFNAESPDDMMNSELLNYLEKFEKELQRLESEFDKNKEYFPKTNCYIFELKSPYGVLSTISSLLSKKYPDAGIFAIRKNKELRVSARCQTGRIDMAKLLKETTKGIGAGGGHERAAGASVPKKNGEKFLESLRERLELG